MSTIDGRWQLEAGSPMGKQVSTIDITTDGQTAAGTVTGGDGTSADILKATVDGPDVAFTIEVKVPIPMRIAFTLRFEGDAVSGKVKAGMFPASKAAGHRLPSA